MFRLNSKQVVDVIIKILKNKMTNDLILSNLSNTMEVFHKICFDFL